MEKLWIFKEAFTIAKFLSSMDIVVFLRTCPVNQVHHYAPISVKLKAAIHCIYTASTSSV